MPSGHPSQLHQQPSYMHQQHTYAYPAALPMGQHFQADEPPSRLDMAYPQPPQRPVGFGSFSVPHADAGPYSHGEPSMDGDWYSGARDTGTMSLSSSTDALVEMSGDMDKDVRNSLRKKTRVTLARGHACVGCRQRKLKCQEGIRPCATCVKAGVPCRDEELPKKKPKNVMLEERIIQLEGLLNYYQKGHALPSRHSVSDSVFSGYSTSSTPPEMFYQDLSGEPGQSQMPMSYRRQPQSTPSLTSPASRIDIPPGSPMELALVQFIMPFTPFLLIPVHPQRFISLLSLPPGDPSRPHPALLYVFFHQAVVHLESNTPPPNTQSSPFHFPSTSNPSPVPVPSCNAGYILSHLQGASDALLERARTELQAGFHLVDRPFDLTRAAIGIARALYSQCKFVEAWLTPVASLVVACGLHRISGSYVPPDTASTNNPDLPKPYAAPNHYSHAHTPGQPTVGQPQLRMRPTLIPPARDETEVAERIMTFWAAKRHGWTTSVGWGWTEPLSDDECTTQWPWGMGHVEAKTQIHEEDFNLSDLFDSTSNLHRSTQPDSTYVLGVKSTALLSRAAGLFDLPEADHPVNLPDGTITTSYIAPLDAVESVETALALFRQRIPALFSFPPVQPAGGTYDGPSDPWWILFHANLYAAEMLMWREMANHRPHTMVSAVQCAKALLNLVQIIPDENWANVDNLVAFAISLAARLLAKEAAALQAAGALDQAAQASVDCESLKECLEGPFSRHLGVAAVYSRMVQRISQGWPEKDGVFERI